MTAILLALLAADVFYFHQPRVRPCGDAAYLLPVPPPPPAIPPLTVTRWTLVGPMPTNAPLPNAGTAKMTFEEMSKQLMRRRNQ